MAARKCRGSRSSDRRVAGPPELGIPGSQLHDDGLDLCPGSGAGCATQILMYAADSAATSPNADARVAGRPRRWRPRTGRVNSVRDYGVTREPRLGRPATSKATSGPVTSTNEFGL